MRSAYKESVARVRAMTTFWERLLYQAALLVTAVTAWRVLRSPSTMTFFAFELGAALSAGLFLHLRHDAPRLHDEKPMRIRRRPTNGDPHQFAGTDPASRRGAPERKSLEPDGSSPLSPRYGRAFFGLSGVFFVVVAVAVLDLSRSIYTASLQFYALLGIAAGVLALNVYTNRGDRSASLLVQIVILGALLKFYFFYLNPYVYTSDNVLHFNGLRDLATQSYIPASLGHYYFFPGFVTFAYEGVRVTGAPLELFGAFGFISQMAIIPIIYLIGRRIASPKVGLLASMFILFAIYTFEYVHAGPTHYGITFVFLAMYAAIRIESDSGRTWFVVFWLSAMAAMLSHPINALILALVLAVRALRHRTGDLASVPTRASSIGSGLAYVVTYISYLAFVAYTAFDLFVRTFVVVDYAPPLASTPSVTLERSALFVLQSALAPIGIAIPVLLAGYSVPARLGMQKSEHGFLTILGAIFLLIPGFEILGENFKLQSSRMLIYLAIPLVFLAAHGLVIMSRGEAPARRSATLVLALFVALGFVASSSYLAQNDSRVVYTDVPFVPTHLSESAASSRRFMDLIPMGSAVYLDLGTGRYFENSGRARDALVGRNTLDLVFFQEMGGSGFVVLNDEYLAYGTPSTGSFYVIPRILERLQDQSAVQLYDSGTVRILYVP